MSSLPATLPATALMWFFQEARTGHSDGVFVSVIRWETDSLTKWGDTVLRVTGKVDNKVALSIAKALPHGTTQAQACRIGITWFDWAVKNHPAWDGKYDVWEGLDKEKTLPYWERTEEPVNE